MLLWLDITKAFMVPIPRTSSIHGGQQEMLQRWTDNLIFRAGTRTCIGKNISLSRIHKLVPQVLQQFDLPLKNSSKD